MPMVSSVAVRDPVHCCILFLVEQHVVVHVDDLRPASVVVLLCIAVAKFAP